MIKIEKQIEERFLRKKEKNYSIANYKAICLLEKLGFFSPSEKLINCTELIFRIVSFFNVKYFLAQRLNK